MQPLFEAGGNVGASAGSVQRAKRIDFRKGGGGLAGNAVIRRKAANYGGGALPYRADKMLRIYKKQSFFDKRFDSRFPCVL